MNPPNAKNRIRDEYTSKWTSLNGSVVSEVDDANFEEVLKKRKE
jgi:hypothetical protein